MLKKRENKTNKQPKNPTPKLPNKKKPKNPKQNKNQQQHQKKIPQPPKPVGESSGMHTFFPALVTFTVNDSVFWGGSEVLSSASAPFWSTYKECLRTL